MQEPKLRKRLKPRKNKAPSDIKPKAEKPSAPKPQSVLRKDHAVRTKLF